MKSTKTMLLAMMMLLSSCAPNGNVIDDSFCSNAKPIYVSKYDIISGITAREIIEHNDYGKIKCGWLPSSR